MSASLDSTAAAAVPKNDQTNQDHLNSSFTKQKVGAAPERAMENKHYTLNVEHQIHLDNVVYQPYPSAFLPLDDTNLDLWGYGEDEIPVTSNTDDPLIVRGDPSSISGCCVLNNMGSLLALHGNKLKGTINQQFFMQRIVATTPVKSVLLIYPEGMLFPSLFWKDDDQDGAILGEIPCGLLVHDSTLRKHGIASSQSHIRARIMNAGLGVSTDTWYICYAFDEMVNLECRHEDVRVIYSSSWPNNFKR